MTDRVVRGRRVVTPSGVLTDVELVVSGGRIAQVRAASGPEGPDGLAGWVVPGFVDTHCHGGGGADYATTDTEEALRARAFHRRNGTTTTYASLVTADLATLTVQIEALRPLVQDGALAGLHLEGPFLAAAKRGAHDPELLRPPTRADLDRLLAAGAGTIAMVTLAPELDGALAAIEHLSASGVVAAVGHTDGDETITRAALDAGATLATHLFNAMNPVHHRRPGPIPLLLTDPRVGVELIGDGFHLHPDVIALAVAAAGPGRVVLVTDAMAAAGMPDGNYSIGALDVAVRDGRARLVEPDGGLGSIAGSTLTMAAAVERLVAYGLAVPEVAAMAATTPAARHGLTEVGRIEGGTWADLCLLDDGGRLQRVMHRGEWVV